MRKESKLCEEMKSSRSGKLSEKYGKSQSKYLTVDSIAGVNLCPFIPSSVFMPSRCTHEFLFQMLWNFVLPLLPLLLFHSFLVLLITISISHKIYQTSSYLLRFFVFKPLPSWSSLFKSALVVLVLIIASLYTLAFGS